MQRTRWIVIAPLALMVPLVSLAGCDSSGTTSERNTVAPDVRSEPLIEEPDLYKLVGATLYVQNRTTGLSIVDVGDPKAPRLVGRTAIQESRGAELFVQGATALVLFDSVTLDEAKGCRWLPGTIEAQATTRSVLAIADVSRPDAPTLLGRWCVPGGIAASRTYDGTLLLAMAQGSRSRVLTVDVSAPTSPRATSGHEILGDSREILLTEEVMVVVAERRASTSSLPTEVELFSVDRTSGVQLKARGTIRVEGAPQGRFHMDLRGGQFRIVTFGSSSTSSSRGSSLLTVVDVRDLDHPSILSTLRGIGSNEQLYATRFDEDLAYVVTFRRTDPLWVISLKDPAAPEIVGELVVPGWSDFLFPRGDRLIAVGRAADTRSVGVSLFDVADPAHPKALSMLTLGSELGGGISEANLDHRGVTILDALGPSGGPAVVVPYATVERKSLDHDRSACTVRNFLQLIDVGAEDLSPLGEARLKGTIRRSFPVGEQLYALSDYELTSLDVADPYLPVAAGSVTLGTRDTLQAGAEETCTASTVWLGDDMWHGCSVGRSGRVDLVLVVLTAFGLLSLALRSRGSRRREGLVRLVVVALTLLGGTAFAEPAAPPEAMPAPAQPEQRIELAPPRLVPVAEAPAAARPVSSEAPPTYEERRRVGLGVTGLAIFGGAWLMSASIGYVTAGAWELSVPLAGPFLYLHEYRKRFDCSSPDPETIVSCNHEDIGDRTIYAALAVDAIAQVGGAALAIAGFATKKKVPVRRLAVGPLGQPGAGGLVVSGRF